MVYIGRLTATPYGPYGEIHLVMTPIESQDADAQPASTRKTKSTFMLCISDASLMYRDTMI